MLYFPGDIQTDYRFDIDINPIYNGVRGGRLFIVHITCVIS